MSEDRTKVRSIKWYRTPLDREQLKELSRRTDAQGFAQTLGFLGIYLFTAVLALVSAPRWPVSLTVALVFLHGMVAAFCINGVHELIHGNVFKTRWLNDLFVKIVAFLGWNNHEYFKVSHLRHHAYTLHPPDDLEVVLPIKLMLQHFVKQGFVSPLGVWYVVKETLRVARGQFKGDWENTLFPEGKPQVREAPMNWAKALLIGHGAIVGVSLILALAHSRYWLLVPVLTTLAPFYGGWLFWLCNNTQHVGLQDNVPDFRLCCRTFYLNPVVRLLYWQMNYHTEHHMYPTVPCYNLHRLHDAIKYELPPTPTGLIACWAEIVCILEKQKRDPDYRHVAECPVRVPNTVNAPELAPDPDPEPQGKLQPAEA